MPKVTVCIDKDEWYPVFTIDSQNNFGHKVEVEQETLDRWKATFAEFEKVQDAIHDAYHEADNKSQPVT